MAIVLTRPNRTLVRAAFGTSLSQRIVQAHSRLWRQSTRSPNPKSVTTPNIYEGIVPLEQGPPALPSLLLLSSVRVLLPDNSRPVYRPFPQPLKAPRSAIKRSYTLSFPGCFRSAVVGLSRLPFVVQFTITWWTRVRSNHQPSLRPALHQCCSLGASAEI